jgi:ubiquitin carboxyl-terminal hydrolase 10
VRIDDDVVVDVRPEDVFGGGGGGERERDEAKCAYLLFYRRV